MSQSKLFDYNTSFSVIRTNPKISGNFKITVDSSGGVWFNSMNANQTLSSSRFKRFNITGDNSYSVDLFNYFDKGTLSNSIVFDVAKFTDGDKRSAENFSGQYDFFYSSGASLLIDGNYNEDFSYFQPLWVKNEIPDFFVVFKVPGPLSYSYTENQTKISNGISYKVIQDYSSDGDFIIQYGIDPYGNPKSYKSGDIFKGVLNVDSYSILSGSGKVAIFNELNNISLVDNIDSTFREKILPNCRVIKTFDLRESTKIGKYIRSIFNNPGFSSSPLEINWGNDSYSYFKGVSYSEGVFSKKGEQLSSFLSSSKSDPMIDLEDYITSGFSRNGLICPNLLNLEFLFNDEDSDLYTINRYFGLYVSRNDVSELQLNGNFFFKHKNDAGNLNLPKPSVNNVGYYDNNFSNPISSSCGVRLYYEGASGYLPGSDNVNVEYSDKLFYLTDKYDNFYSLKRIEKYSEELTSGTDISCYQYGPYRPETDSFGTTGSFHSNSSGSLVIHNTKTDLLNFTGSDKKIATVPGSNASKAGNPYFEVEFLKNWEFPEHLTFKIYWPNGSIREGGRKYDLVKSGDFSAVLIWTGGSYYSSGTSYYFNAITGSTTEIASAFSSLIRSVDTSTWDSANNSASSIIRSKFRGIQTDKSYSVSIFDNYDEFTSRFKGSWDSTSSYSQSDIVLYNETYYSALNNIVASTTLSPSPDDDIDNWEIYYTFSKSGYVKINGADASQIFKNVNFIGGSDTKECRVVFSNKYSNIVKPGYFINTLTGTSEILEVTKYVDEPIIDSLTGQITSFNNFDSLLVANLANQFATVQLGSDGSFNVYSSNKSHIGVFTFFDVKEFDFDFWSSEYSYTPTPETYKYYQLEVNRTGEIEANIPYFVKSGQILYSGSIYNTGDLFYGITGSTSFINSAPSLNSLPVVFPAQYSNITYTGNTNYSNIDYYQDFNTFDGFIGIQSLDPTRLSSSASKLDVFNNGKLNTEYEYLWENYTIERSNISRIVPYINKWGYFNGYDARGNQYRLNSSPAFTPLNFSPSLDKISIDTRYLTMEWFLLEQPPRNFPVEDMGDQKSYLSDKIDLDKARSANPEDSLYLSSYFTVEPGDYPQEYVDEKNYTKELFSSFQYNPASSYYETIFRGIKVVLKKRVENYTSSTSKYIPNYRGYEDYKFSAILRIVNEDDSIIQAPVSYEVIENAQQKFVLFVCNLVMKDQRLFPLGSIQSDDYIIDYTTLYSAKNKTSVTPPTLITTGSGDGWTGTDFSSGYTHEYNSSADPLISDVFSAATGAFYNLVYEISGVTAGSVSIGFCGVNIGSGITASGNSVIKAAANSGLEVTPTLDFTGAFSAYLEYPITTGSKFTYIDDVKLSSGLDLSLAAGSLVDTNTGVNGRINIAKNNSYDTDLREEIHLFYVQNPIGATAPTILATGIGSFSVPSISCTYPWPTGIGPSYVNFGQVSEAQNYIFNVPFSISSPVTVPVGSNVIYKDAPVFQVGGGEKYFSGILNRCTAAYISQKINSSSSYITYTSYFWNDVDLSTDSKSNGFEIYFEPPTKIIKPLGTSFSKSYTGPQDLRGTSKVTNYVLNPDDSKYSSILVRYSGFYEPIFRKVIHFNKDKTDSISAGTHSIDLSYRNCNFDSGKYYFGVSRNLSYTKVSLGNPILALSSSIPEGPVYPLVGQTPIAIRDFNLFSSSWDPGYYRGYTSATTYLKMAGTRSMKEIKTFFGSKIMKTPDSISAPNYITLEISRTSGSTSISSLNSIISGFIKPIQNITSSNSGKGIGSVGPYLSGVDFNKLDLSIFPESEIFWQYFKDINKLKGIIRLDRILRRFLLNSGIKNVFIDNIISEFGVGDPNSINDDINSYIDLNVSPAFQGGSFNLYVKKTASQENLSSIKEAVRGDFLQSDLINNGYILDNNYSLTSISSLVYEFEYPLEKNYNYSIQFDLSIIKI
jgi:hypothetical protein